MKKFIVTVCAVMTVLVIAYAEDSPSVSENVIKQYPPPRKLTDRQRRRLYGNRKPVKDRLPPVEEMIPGCVYVPGRTKPYCPDDVEGKSSEIVKKKDHWEVLND